MEDWALRRFVDAFRGMPTAPKTLRLPRKFGLAAGRRLTMSTVRINVQPVTDGKKEHYEVVDADSGAKLCERKRFPKMAEAVLAAQTLARHLWGRFYVNQDGTFSPYASHSPEAIKARERDVTLTLLNTAIDKYQAGDLDGHVERLREVEARIRGPQ